MIERRFKVNVWEHLVKEQDQSDPQYVLSWCGLRQLASETTQHDSTEPWGVGCFKCIATSRFTSQEGQ